LLVSTPALEIQITGVDASGGVATFVVANTPTFTEEPTNPVASVPVPSPYNDPATFNVVLRNVSGC
jgi:hypothetical protein